MAVTRTDSLHKHTVVHAEAVTTVHKYEVVVYDKPTEGPALEKIHLEESFTGAIEGSGIAEVLRAAGNESANLVTIERITGRIASKTGTFLLQVASTVEGKKMDGKWFVIPDPGTGQLAGLRGTGGFIANMGESGRAYLDYWFE